MSRRPYAPNSAAAHSGDYWIDLPEGADTLPGDVPLMPRTLGGPNGLDRQPPYTPEAVAAGQTAPDDIPAEAAPYVPAEGAEAEDAAGDPAAAGEADNDDDYDAMEAAQEMGPSDADPLGSWTGVPEEEEQPTQDADDL